MLQAVLVTIVIAAMIGITVSYTQLDPWVAVLAAVVVCLRFVWNRAT
jgi:ABC-type uncharacterized transport system permease subunit